jgi:hypothetical protein
MYINIISTCVMGVLWLQLVSSFINHIFVWISLCLYVLWYVSTSREHGDAARACICRKPHSKISVDTLQFYANVRVSVSTSFYSIVGIMFLAYVLNLTHFLGTTPEPGHQCVYKKQGTCIYCPWFSAVFEASVLQSMHRRKDSCSWW